MKEKEWSKVEDTKKNVRKCEAEGPRRARPGRAGPGRGLGGGKSSPHARGRFGGRQPFGTNNRYRFSALWLRSRP